MISMEVINLIQSCQETSFKNYL